MIFEYIGHNSYKAKCDIEIHSNNLVVATELWENEGMSITNAVEKLASMICDRYTIPYNKLIWVEHYTERHNYTETFDKVTFDIDRKGFSNPKWERISKDEVEKLMCLIS